MKYSFHNLKTLFRRNFTCKKIFTFRNFLMLGVLFYLLPEFRYARPGIGGDLSWIISLNYASHENFVFGKEFIFTYGPLGFLTFGLPMYTSRLLVILFYFFIVINAIYFLYYVFKSLEKKSELVLVSATFFFFGEFVFTSSHFSRESIPLYFYFTFHIFHYLKHKNFFSLIVASTCGLLAFYIKVNAGFIINILFLLFIIYNFIFKTIDRKANIILFAAHFTVLYFSSFILKTDFISYIINSFPIIDSYNEGMTVPAKQSDLLAAVLIIILFLTVIIMSVKSIIRTYHDIFLLFNLLLLGFIFFKSGFTRADLHVIFFFGGIPFVIMLAFLFFKTNKAKSALFISIILTTMITLAFCRWFDGPRLNKINSLKFSIKSGFFPTNVNMPVLQDKNYRKLPERVMKEIGGKTVDVLGKETSYIYYNNLRYNPRPVIQSYSAYDEKLININYDKYKSNSAPDFILYHYDRFDDRHGFWDEPKIYLAVLSNYTILDTILAPNNIDSLILFKKSQATKKITEQVILDTLIHFNTRFKIPYSDKILYMKLDYDYTISGKIRRMIFQPSSVYMNLMYENSDSTFCRLVMPVMKSGVPINKKVTSFNDAFTFFNSNGIMNKRSTYFMLTGDLLWIKDSFKVRIIEYEVL
jgi:hypothetical protein